MNTSTEITKPHAIFADVVDPKAMEQFASAMSQDFAVSGALMPDVHAGYSLPIGSVVATKDVVVPAWVGYDIGCGMCAMPVSGIDPEELRVRGREIYDELYRTIPVGNAKNSEAVQFRYENVCAPTDAGLEAYARRGGDFQLGTLGSGNHFIEIGLDAEDMVWIVIHSGSRGVGHGIAEHYMKMASGTDRAVEGHFGFDTNNVEGEMYIRDLDFALKFALANRKTMLNRAVDSINSVIPGGEARWGLLINRNHNHAEPKDGLWIHRKGATHAEDGMMGVIPGNMRDGSFIVRGKGNPSSLFSSSHGAGRVLGRKEAQRKLSMDDFKQTMTAVVAKVEESTLDESPFAYKDIFSVMEQQKDLVEVLAHVKPIINIKG